MAVSSRDDQNDDDFDGEEKRGGGTNWIKVAIIGTTLVIGAAKVYSKLVEKGSVPDKWNLKQKIDTVLNPLGGMLNGGAKILIRNMPIIKRLPKIKTWVVAEDVV